MHMSKGQAHASSVAHAEAPSRGWEPGHQQHSGPECTKIAQGSAAAAAIFRHGQSHAEGGATKGGVSKCLQDTKRVPKSEGYLNRSFPGVRKGGVKGEVKRGEVV